MSNRQNSSSSVPKKANLIPDWMYKPGNQVSGESNRQQDHRSVDNFTESGVNQYPEKGDFTLSSN